MKSITKEQCEQFKKTPTINPLTGRKIAVGKITHKKLQKLCKDEKKPYIPPLGPMMHWSYDDIHGDNRDLKNIREFGKFLNAKYFELKENNIKEISKSEIMDYIEMCKEISQTNGVPSRIYEYVASLGESFKELKKTMKLINDQPKHDVYANMEIRPSRTFNRGRVAWTYNFYMQTRRSIERELENKTNLVIPKEHIKRIKEFKSYHDHLIKLNVFSYDDIYKHTFKNDQYPQEIDKLYKQYLKKYRM